MRIIINIIAIISCFFIFFSNKAFQFIPQNIAIIGTGYVGLVTGACLAEIGHQVICIDVDAKKIDLLQRGVIPIFEIGLEKIVTSNIGKGRLKFTTSLKDTIVMADFVFIAVGTPTDEVTGKTDLSILKNAIYNIAPYITSYKVIVVKSTVPVGTNEWVRSLFINDCKVSSDFFDVVSNPEFLREGTSVYDFFNPDRIVIGTNNEKTAELLKNIYYPILSNNIPVILCDLPTAEMIKYASNVFLAAKIGFINEIANLCGKTDANISLVAKAMGLDPRIGPHFLKPGPGFGGSCLPKDTQALLSMAKENNVNAPLLEAISLTNKIQQQKPFAMLSESLDNNFDGKIITILGLAFKAGTDDVRYSPAITTIKELLKYKVTIKVYDPQAMKNMKLLFPSIEYCDSSVQAIKDSDAIIVLTEWDEFKAMSFDTLKSSTKKIVIIDARNILEPLEMQKKGFYYYAIGRYKK